MNFRTAYLFIGFLFLLLSCNSNDSTKQQADKVVDSSASKEPSVTDTTTASIQKEFADSVSKGNLDDAPRLLKFNLQPGKAYNYTINLNLSQKNGEVSRGTDMRWNYDLKVLDKKNGLTTIQATYKRIDMIANMGKDQKMEFSSEKNVDAMDFMQMPSKMFSIIKGKSFTMQVDEKGKVVSITGFDKIGDAVVNEMGLPEEMKPMARQSFQKQFNDEAVKQLFSQSFDALPNRTVKRGDTWKTSSDLSSRKQTISTIYTVKNIKGQRVFLTGDSKLISTEGTNTATQKSQLVIDSRTGLMLDGTFDQKSGDGNVVSKTRIIGREF
jgi:hypothetical protein